MIHVQHLCSTSTAPLGSVEWVYAAKSTTNQQHQDLRLMYPRATVTKEPERDLMDCILFKPLPHICYFWLFQYSTAVNKDMMAKIWTNGDTSICLSRKHCGKRRNCSLGAISPFPHNAFKSRLAVVDLLEQVSME